MNENFDEINQVLQDALEDGILMGVSETQMKQTLFEVVNNLTNPYGENK